jgi:hypothetical protein
MRNQKVFGIGIPVSERLQIVLVEQWLGHSAMDRAYQTGGGVGGELALLCNGCDFLSFVGFVWQNQ